MAKGKKQESKRLRAGRKAWFHAIDEYKRQVKFYVNGESDSNDQVPTLTAAQQSEFIAKITGARDEYDNALRDDGRDVPHRVK